jgi:DNA polymerase III epsilon subunit-like protein
VEKFLIYDCETGGLHSSEHSLLTIYGGVFTFDNGKFTLQSEIDLKIKPNDGESYNVTPGALLVNKIDLVKHDKEAVSINEAARLWYNFLFQESCDGANKLIRVGHNEPFDNGFVVNNLLKESIWRKFTDYHTIDTVSLARGLKLKGRLPKGQKLNLAALAKFLEVPSNESDLHTAKGDTHLCARVLEILLTL